MRKLLTLLVDGFGLNTSWQGNAILSAQPRVFLELWAKYPKAILKPLKQTASELGFNFDPANNHAILFSGQDVMNNYDFLSKKLTNHTFYENNPLNNILRQIDINLSTLHLLFTLSPDGFYADLMHLQSIIQQTKQHRSLRLFLHLIVASSDNQRDALLAKVDQLESILAQNNAGEIISLAGQNYYCQTEYHKLSDVVNSLFRGKGKRALNAKQAIKLYSVNLSDLGELPPVNILGQDGEPRLINDFDSLLSVDFAPNKMERFLSLAVNPRMDSAPKSLAAFALVDDFSLSSSEIRIVFPQKTEESLFSFLDQNKISQELIIESSRQEYFRRKIENVANLARISILPNDASRAKKEYGELIRSLGRQVLKQLNKSESRLIVAEFSILDALTTAATDFHHLSQAAKLIDQSLGEIYNQAMKMNYDLIFLSTFGKAESGRKNEAPFNIFPSFSPLPLILASPDYTPKTGPIGTMVDSISLSLLQKQKSLIDVAPTILDIFGLAKPEFMTGQSLFADGIIL